MYDKTMRAKSIHTFAYPFKFGEETDKIKDFINATGQRGWKLKDMGYSEQGNTVKKRENFMRYQYFTAAARDIFYRGKEGACAVYEYGNTEAYSYYIKTANEEFELEIGEIELHLYDCGVGILLLQILNEKYLKISEIKLINDYGRRISIPFLPATEDGGIICAEKLGILKAGASNAGVEQRELSVTNFRQRIKDNEKLDAPAEFLEEIIYHQLGVNAVHKKDSNLEYYTDDRLFLMCVLRDDSLSEVFQKGLDHVLPSMENLLYQLIYVDPYDSGCQDADMKKELLKKAIYPRWANWGTIHAATAYSMFCITGENHDIDESVVRPFVVEYTYIFSLVLAQRFCVSLFSELAGKAVVNVDKKGKISRTKAKELGNLQERYVAFKNKLIILQISPQEQGMELYHLLQSQFMLQEEQAVLDEQLESLYEIINTSNSNRLNGWALWFALIAIGWEVFVFFYESTSLFHFLSSLF